MRKLRSMTFAGSCLLLGLAAFQVWAQERQLQVAPTKPAPAGERRVALVIGNSSYKTSPLKNPVRDARAISKVLAATGFKVTVIEDASLTTMRRAIRAFGDDLMGGGVGLFYYAGHGMQVRGKNYLIPTNADIEREDEVEDQALDANTILAKMDSAKNALNLMILDACRNNPFSRGFRNSVQGLAQMDAPSGTLVAFATAPGSVASDGTGENGLYTKHLLASIVKPGLPIEQVFKEVRRGVGRDTGDRQIPWESSSLRGDFFFIAPDASTAGEVQKAQMERAVADAVRREQDKLAVQQRQMEQMVQEMLAKQRAEIEELKKQRGEGTPAIAAAAPPRPAAPTLVAANPSARDQMDLEFWNSVKTSNTPADYQAYLAQFPQGTFAALARARAGGSAQVSRPAPGLGPAPVPTQVAAAAPSAMIGVGIEDSRFPRVGDSWEYRYSDLTSRQSRTLRYQIAGVSRAGIVESGGLGDPRDRRVYAPGAQLLFNDIWDFSPYLTSFGAPATGHRWRALEPVKGLVYCSQASISCRFEGRVAGVEKVTVPAGTFEAVKVSVDMVSYINLGIARTVTTEMLFWYAERAKRMVKASVRTFGTSASGQVVSTDYDMELTSYKLH
jgi:uncharacterized caspase-like protein